MRKARIEPGIFWPGLVSVITVTAILIILPNAENKAASLLAAITHSFDWLFLGSVFAMFILLLWLAFSRYGKVKFGAPDDAPDFSTFSWIAMLFNAGIGSSLFYWAMAEPVYYISGPPFEIAPNSGESLEWAVAYGMFHWGFSAWGTYAIPALAIAYTFHVRKSALLRPSSACGHIGQRAGGWVGKIIDLTIVIGLVGGIGTALGVNVPMVSTLVGKMLDRPDSLQMQIIILVIWTALFGTSAYLGLRRGIKKLSDLNAITSIALLFFVLLAGPTLFILSNFTNSMGLLLNNFPRMSFYTDPILKSGFPQNWTVFYWAWWITWAVYMGLFVARISKGRTIRELICAELVCGSLGCFAYFAVFGGYAVYLEGQGALSLTKILEQQGAAEVIAAILSSLPAAGLILPLFVLICIISQATGLDAAAYTLAAICTRQSDHFDEPAPWHRLFWALVLGTMALGLLVVGGLRVVQLSSVITAVPIIFILFIFIFSLFKWLREDHPLKPRS